MARTTSFDGAFEDMPISMRRAAEADRSYYPQAACRTTGNTPRLAWTAEAGRKYKVGNMTYRGARLIELALEACRYCPVQWDCASTAIEAHESAGTWSDTIENVRWLGRQKNEHEKLIDMARSTGVPMQRAIVMLRDGLT